MGRLDVRIIGCKNLPNEQLISDVDPYVRIECENKQYKTKVAENSANPKFDEVFKFVLSDPDSVRISFKVWNSNMVSDDFLGQYEMSISGLTKGQPSTSWHLLTQCKTNAEIGVELLAHDFGKDPVAVATTTAVPSSPPQQYYQQQPPPQQQQQQPMMVNIPMPQGPSAFAGFVPPVPQQFMNTTGAQGQLTHCRNQHRLSNTAPFDKNRMQLWCDLCFHECVGGSGAKQCRQCDLDICNRCQQVYSFLPPRPICPQGCPLEPRPDPSGWSCDVCRRGSDKGSMRCKRCDFDICDKCFPKYVSSQWQHIKTH